MKRADFIRNTILGLTASLLPRILQPAAPEIIEEKLSHPEWRLYEGYVKDLEMRQVTNRTFWWLEYVNGNLFLRDGHLAPPDVTITLSKNSK